ncbi:MAG: hypothetical protein CVV04_11895 [Firmicutes bacterium HGW-Firmicutes-9]|jgi:hypothetical protein|nr:MAG: hypothetical protein CVV04_11895 [Firmicutes bacterium HGW-Firmicutes-9]
MHMHLRLKTMSGIYAQAEDYSADGIENPFRLTAFIPNYDGKPKFKPVQFAFGSMAEVSNAIFALTYSGKKLKDYASKLIEPDNERLLTVNI